MNQITRRTFLQTSLLRHRAASACLPVPGPGSAGANEDIRIAMIGFHGRGEDHCRDTKGCARPARRCGSWRCAMWTKTCWPGGIKTFNERGEDVLASRDIRQLLENKNIDAVLDRHARTTGIRSARSGPARPARTSTSRSRLAQHLGRAADVGRPASTAASSRPAPRAAPARAPRRSFEWLRGGKLGQDPRRPRPVLQARAEHRQGRRRRSRSRAPSITTSGAARRRRSR